MSKTLSLPPALPPPQRSTQEATQTSPLVQKEVSTFSLDPLKDPVLLKSDPPYATMRKVTNVSTTASTFVRCVVVAIRPGPVPPNSVTTISRLIGKNDAASVFFSPSIGLNPADVEVWCLVVKARSHAVYLVRKPLTLILPYLRVRDWSYANRDFTATKRGTLATKNKHDTQRSMTCIELNNTNKLWIEEGLFSVISDPNPNVIRILEKSELPQLWTSFAETLEIMTSSSAPSKSSSMPSHPHSPSSSPPSHSSSADDTKQDEVLPKKTPKLETFITPPFQVYDKSVTSKSGSLLYYYYFIDFIPEKK